MMADEPGQEKRTPSAAGSTQLVEGARSYTEQQLNVDSPERATTKFSADAWRMQALSSADLIASHKIFLCALSMMFDEDGYCFATAKELGEATSSSTNTVTRCGQVLEEKGWFTRKRKRHGTEYYALRGRDSP